MSVVEQSQVIQDIQMGRAVLFQPSHRSNSLGSPKYPIVFWVRSCNDDLTDVFKLRYRAYINDGHLPHDPSGLFFDRTDHLNDTIQVVAVDSDACVGALRLNFTSPGNPGLNLPCAPYYSEVAHIAREHNRRLVEISRLAIAPNISNTSYRTTLYASMVRAALMAAEAGYATDILVATKPGWVGFYKYMLGCVQIEQPQKYPPGDIEITLLGVSLAQAQTRQRFQNGFFRISRAEIECMRATLATVISPSASSARNTRTTLAFDGAPASSN